MIDVEKFDENSQWMEMKKRRGLKSVCQGGGAKWNKIVKSGVNVMRKSEWKSEWEDV